MSLSFCTLLCKQLVCLCCKLPCAVMIWLWFDERQSSAIAELLVELLVTYCSLSFVACKLGVTSALWQGVLLGETQVPSRPNTTYRRRARLQPEANKLYMPSPSHRYDSRCRVIVLLIDQLNPFATAVSRRRCRWSSCHRNWRRCV